MNLRKTFNLICFSLCLSSLLLAETYKVEATTSTVRFEIGLARVRPVIGEFHKFSGTAEFDPKTQTLNKVSASIEVESVDTQEQRRDKHLRSADFFDVANFPHMTFVADNIQTTATGEYTAAGRLTIKNITRPIVLTGKLTHMSDKNGKPTVVFSTTGVIDRQDFKVNFNQKNRFGEWLLSDEVKLMIDVTLIQE